MSVQQVEEILGKPLFVVPPGVGNPSEDMRRYEGNADYSIVVIYKDGVLEEVRNLPLRH